MNKEYMYFLRIAGKYLEQLGEKDCPLFLAEERDFWIGVSLRTLMEETCK